MHNVKSEWLILKRMFLTLSKIPYREGVFLKSATMTDTAVIYKNHPGVKS